MKQFFKDPGLINFCQKFNASVEESPKKFYKPVTHHIQEWEVNGSPDKIRNELPTFQLRAEKTDAIAIHIPAYMVQDFISAIDERHIQAVDLRHRYPAVKKAYDNYMLMLKMCGEEDA